MIETLLLEFRSWQQDWDLYEKQSEIMDTPPSVDEFTFYLKEKYPELNKLEKLYAQI